MSGSPVSQTACRLNYRLPEGHCKRNAVCLTSNSTRTDVSHSCLAVLRCLVSHVKTVESIVKSIYCSRSGQPGNAATRYCRAFSKRTKAEQLWLQRNRGEGGRTELCSQFWHASSECNSIKPVWSGSTDTAMPSLGYWAVAEPSDHTMTA